MGRARMQDEVADVDRAGAERLERGHRAEDRGLARTRESHQRADLPACDVQRHSAEHVHAPTGDVKIADGERAGHAAFHRRSRRRAKRDSGSDMARYTIAQRIPGTAQLPMFAA